MSNEAVIQQAYDMGWAAAKAYYEAEVMTQEAKSALADSYRNAMRMAPTVEQDEIFARISTRYDELAAKGVEAMTLTEVEEMLTPAQAARILDVTPERVRQLADSGGLAVTRTALGRLFSRADVEALAKSRAQANV